MKDLLRTGLVLLGLLAGLAVGGAAQAPEQPKFGIYVDTAGVSAVAPDIYVTWIFAKASPKAFPSSGILVAFDCENHLVQRLAHVVYRLTPDGRSVTGEVVEDQGGWVSVSIPELFNLVCAIGATRPAPSFRGGEPPARERPRSPYSDA
jgi:hypothetical protein